MKFSGWLDKALLFFFIDSKGSARTSAFSHFMHKIELPTPFSPAVINAFSLKTIYDIQIRRGLGLGFIASFIPGTSYFKTRRDYFNSLIALEDYTKKILTGINPVKSYFSWLLNLENYIETDEEEIFINKEYYLTVLLTRLSMTPLVIFNSLIQDYHYFIVSSLPQIIATNKKYSFMTIFLNYFPIVSDFSKAYDKNKTFWKISIDFLKNIFHSILNPARPLLALLLFAQYTLLRLAMANTDVISDNTRSSKTRFILKALIGILFIPFLVITATINNLLDHILDLPLQLYNFAKSVVKQAHEHFGKESIYTDAKTCRDVKVVRKISKMLQQTICKHDVSEQEKSALDMAKFLAAHPSGLAIYSEKSRSGGNKTFFSLPKDILYDREALAYERLKKVSLIDKCPAIPLGANYPILVTTTAEKARVFRTHATFFQNNPMDLYEKINKEWLDKVQQHIVTKH